MRFFRAQYSRVHQILFWAGKFMLKKLAGLTIACMLLVCGNLFAGAAPAEENLWMTNFEAAKTKAKAEHKLMLVDFTGSDWCGWCIKLHQEVFDLPEFKNEAPKKFVLVELDFPQQKQLSEELTAQNRKLQEKFKVQGFPSIFLTDANGKAITKMGYMAGGPVKYLEAMNGNVTKYESILAIRKKADAAKGLERAKLLDEMLTLGDKFSADSSDDVKLGAEILTLDPDNKTGLKSKYTYKNLIAQSETLTEEKKFDEAKAACEKAAAVPGIAAELKQDAYFAAGKCCFDKQNFGETVAYLIKARDAAPESKMAAQLGAMISRFQGMADAQANVEKLKVELASKKGADRAKTLDQLVDAKTKFNQGMRPGMPDEEITAWTSEISLLDADNKLGLKTKYAFKAAMLEARSNQRKKNINGAKVAVEKALALPGLTPELKAEGEMLKAMLEPKPKSDAPAPAK